ncbi:uncharacterized protein [Typha angustifolia]|uniref:uncharacterized protein n=1 Tax=Typha angustifolia TaxID=59011 RepID=UPI003C2AEE16
MADLLLSNPSHHETLPESYIPTVLQRPRLTEVATGTSIAGVVDTNMDQMSSQRRGGGGGGGGGENGGRQSAVEAKLMRIIFFSYTVSAIFWGLLMAAFPAYQNINQPFSTPIYVGFILFVSTVLSAYILMKYSFNQLKRNPIAPNRLVFIALISISGVLLLVSNGLLLVLVNQRNAVLATLLLPVIVILGILVNGGTSTRTTTDHDHPNIADLEAYELEIKTTFDLSLFINLTAFGLQIGTIFAYLKNFPNQAHPHPRLDLSVSFLTSTLAVFSMMVTSMPLAFNRSIMRDGLVAILKPLRYVMLALLGSSAFVLSTAFLDGITVLAFFPEFIASVAYFAIEFRRGSPDAASPAGGVLFGAVNFKKELDQIFRGSTTANFAMLSVLYAVYMGGEGRSVFFKAFVFFVVSAIIAGLSRIALALKSPETESWAKAMELLTFFSPGLLELGMIATVAMNIVIYLY